MRFRIALVFLAACDLRPAPPKQEPKPPPAPVEPAPAPAPAAAGDAAVPDALADNVIEGAGGTGDGGIVAATPACMAVGEHIADIWIQTAKDVAEKAALAQDRGKLVQKTAEACTQLKWNDATRRCYLDAKTVDQLGPCANVK